MPPDFASEDEFHAFGEELSKATANARDYLLSQQQSNGHWVGELASSSLSTATAMMALHLIDATRHAEVIEKGLHWLQRTQNTDGGFGDTDRSFSNISTSVLVWALFGRLGLSDTEMCRNLASYVEKYCGGLTPEAVSTKIAARYGKDRTFSVPILMMAALGGRLGDAATAWKMVLPLPFELAALPRGTFAALRLPVVSYALPALIAIGQARFHHAPPLPPWRWVRAASRQRTLKLLRDIQPESGGYLEATPLTSFVSMALASCGLASHEVVQAGEKFLLESQRSDGSWPIDSNLATWTSTLSIKALVSAKATIPNQDKLINWLLQQQYKTRHPYTDSPPGGWAWTDLSGGVPDADDTPGALLALHALGLATDTHAQQAALNGLRWLGSVQNRDGGIPTFCRGWGALPFDRSSPDLTAHTLRAINAWLPHLPAEQERLEAMRTACLRYLQRSQQADGSWLPLWFGNQHRPDEANPTYGTAMALLALDPTSAEAKRGLNWLLTHQNNDGGWGGGNLTPSSIEETSLALDAISHTSPQNHSVVLKGTRWLLTATQQGTVFPASPIGFYFAKLWYYEALYPVTWALGALASVKKAIKSQSQEQ